MMTEAECMGSHQLIDLVMATIFCILLELSSLFGIVFAFYFNAICSLIHPNYSFNGISFVFPDLSG